MNAIVMILCVLFSVLPIALSQQLKQQYRHQEKSCCLEIETDDNVPISIHWDIPTGDSISIVMKMIHGKIQMKGYLAFGISASTLYSFFGGVSDFWLAIPTENTVADYSFYPMKLRQDEQSDLYDIDISTDAEGKYIEAHFTRKLDTFDRDGDVLIEDRSYKLLYAYRYDEIHNGMGGRSPDDMGSGNDDINFFTCPNTCKIHSSGKGRAEI